MRSTSRSGSEAAHRPVQRFRVATSPSERPEGKAGGGVPSEEEHGDDEQRGHRDSSPGAFSGVLQRAAWRDLVIYRIPRTRHAPSSIRTTPRTRPPVAGTT